MKAISIIILFIFIIWGSFPVVVTAYNILGIFPLPGSSHYAMFSALMKELARKGHEVDVVSHFPQEKPALRFNDISVKGTLPMFQNQVSFAFLREYVMSRFKMTRLGLEESEELCEKIFNATTIQELRNTKKKYDLVITELFYTDCMLAFGHHFKVPVILMTSSANMPWGSDRFGNPDNPSYIPSYGAHHFAHMTLFQRIENTVILLMNKFMFSQSQAKVTAIARKYFGENLPDIDQLALNTSLLLVNSHYSLTNVIPTVPSFVEVGGLHISPTKHISQDLEQILNVTTTQQYKGVILFSLGSMVLTESLPPDTLTALFSAFSELPYVVLWKASKEKIASDLNVPPNIYFRSWIPQLDVLCHTNVKLFVNHGGLMGTQEAIYCGVPCLGIPLFADQELNVKTLEAHGLALSLDFEDISKETVLAKTRELLENPKYTENAEIASIRFKDRPLSPLDTAVYWVEYVIRHKGARHLRSLATELMWYQYYLLDVGAIIILGVLLIFYVAYMIVRLPLGLLRGSNRNYKQKIN